MIDRNTALAMLQALPDDKILQALQVASGQAGAEGSLAGLSASPTAGSPGNKIVPWSAKEMTYGGGKDRPALIDRMWAKPEENAQVPVEGGAMEADNDNYLQTGGM